MFRRKGFSKVKEDSLLGEEPYMGEYDEEDDGLGYTIPHLERNLSFTKQRSKSSIETEGIGRRSASAGDLCRKREVKKSPRRTRGKTMAQSQGTLEVRPPRERAQTTMGVFDPFEKQAGPPPPTISRSYNPFVDVNDTGFVYEQPAALIEFTDARDQPIPTLHLPKMPTKENEEALHYVETSSLSDRTGEVGARSRRKKARNVARRKSDAEGLKEIEDSRNKKGFSFARKKKPARSPNSDSAHEVDDEEADQGEEGMNDDMIRSSQIITEQKHRTRVRQPLFRYC